MPQIGFQVGGVQAIGSVLMPWMNGDSNVLRLTAGRDQNNWNSNVTSFEFYCLLWRWAGAM
jgi:hypothetical protein